MFDQATGEKVIAQLRSDAESTKAAIADAWYFYSSERDQDVGACQIVEDTSIRALESTLPDTVAGIKPERSWRDLAKTAEDSLKAINHYAGSATISAVLADTATATASDVKKDAQQAAGAVRDVAGAGLSIFWSALPTPAKIAVALGGVGILLFGFVQVRSIVGALKGGVA